MMWTTLGVILSSLSFRVWLAAIREVELGRMNDLGLVSVLPWLVYAAYIGVIISFCLALAQRYPGEGLLAFTTLLMVFMLFGITPLIEEVSRFGSAWKHVGVIDLIMRTGSVDPEIDAYNNWPGYFILGALFTQASGLASAIPFLAWSPVFFNLLYFLPMRAILRSLTADRRLTWLGIWFFYLANWVGQDYFSPQAFSYFLFLVILAVLLTFFVTPGQPAWMESLGYGLSWRARFVRWMRASLRQGQQNAVPLQPAARVALLFLVILAFGVVVASHQLTPFALLVGVTLLVLNRRLSLSGLPLVFFILLVLWIAYMTVAYLRGHLPGMLSFFGQLDQTVGTNLINRLSGSPGHLVIIRLRLVTTLSFWGLAFLGVVRRFRGRRIDLNHLLLALAPFPLLALQSYGGELLLRIYLFALPLMAGFAAALFFPGSTPRRLGRSALLVGLVSAAWLVAFLFIRFGNERMDYFTHQELAAVEYVYENAPPGALLAASSTNMPFRYQNYEQYKHIYLEKLVVQQDTAGMIAEIERRGNAESYLILTRAQQAFLEMFYNYPPDGWERLSAELQASGKFLLVYSNSDGRVYKFYP